MPVDLQDFIPSIHNASTSPAPKWMGTRGLSVAGNVADDETEPGSGSLDPIRE
jgi:hypothetical protein